MDLLGSRNLTLLTLSLLFLVQSSIASGRFRDTRGCCLPDRLSGQVTLSQALRDSLQGHSRSSATPIKFLVDYERGLLYGEHFVRYPLTRHVQFVADIRDEVRKIYIRESTSNRCWTFPLGQRQRKRCSLDDARYRGSFPYDVRGSKRKGTGLIFDRSTQSRNEPLLSWLKFRSLLLVDQDTCLPILDVNGDDLDYYIAFHKVKYGPDSSSESWSFESSTGMMEACTDQGESQDYDIEVGSWRHLGIWREERKKEERMKEADRDRWLRLLKGLGIKTKHDDSYEDENDDSMMEKILQLDIYLYLLRHFFPRAPPEPCCGPIQWQASLTKTITYTYVQSNYVGQSTTTFPNLYVDHKNGRMATDIVEYMNGAMTANHSLLALFGNTSASSQLSIYAVDWTKSPAACTYIQVTDAHGPMRNNCMPVTAQFEKTVRIGSGPFNSVRLDLYNLSGNKSFSGGEIDYNAESYVTPHECMTMMETYSWSSPNTKVSGSLLMSNPLSHIVNANQAFAVPPICSTTTPIQLTSAQIESVISSALAYGGFK